MNKLKMVFALIFMVSICYGQHDENWFVLGKISVSQNNLEKGLNLFSQHIEQNPKDPMGYIHRAKVYKALGRNNESNLDLKIAQRLNPLSLMIVNPALRARTVSKKLYDYNYENVDEPFVKSASNYNSYKKIIDELELLHAQDSLIENVIEYLNDFELDKAEMLLNEVAINTNNEAIIFDLYGKIRMKQERYQKAIEYFNNSIELDSSFAIAYHNRSICYNNLGEVEKSKKDLEKAIALNDNLAVFHFSQAKLNEQLGNKDDAIISYEKAIDLDNDYKEALTNYSQLLKSLGEYSQGVRYLNKVKSEETNDESIFLEANVDFIYGEYEKAINGFEKYLVIHEDDSAAHFNMGLSKILLRKKQEGCVDIEYSLELESSEKHQNLYNLFCD